MRARNAIKKIDQSGYPFTRWGLLSISGMLEPYRFTRMALSNWTEANKRVFIIVYKNFTKTFNLSWDPPKTRVQQKLPFIPSEAEIDQLIAGCGKKTATVLQVLKDTGARGCEASKIQWIDVYEKHCTIRINNPAKGSLPRIVKVTPKTIAMIKALPQNKKIHI